MPKGIPKSGMRMTRGRRAALGLPALVSSTVKHNKEVVVHIAPKFAEDTLETDAEILARLKERFEVLDEITEMAIEGDAKGAVVSGPPGLGKSFTVIEALKRIPEDQYEIISGKVKITGLFKLLYRHRHPGHVIVFDDSDGIFHDEDSLNLLKKVMDSLKQRRVSYLADYTMVDELTGDIIPHTFDFEGSVIFITNHDFDDMINRGHRLAPHLTAIVSRCHYIDLAMKTKRDYMLRIHQVINAGMLADEGLSKIQAADVVAFINENSDNLRELSLRIALKIGALRRTKKNWKRIARVTCCKGIA
jgi:hypothetical protein